MERDEKSSQRLSNDDTQLRVETKSEEYITDPLRKKIHGTIRFIENYKMHIFWLTIYTLILLLIFAERMYCKHSINIYHD